MELASQGGEVVISRRPSSAGDVGPGVVGSIRGAKDLDVSVDGRAAVFSASLSVGTFEEVAGVAEVQFENGALMWLSVSPGASLPRYSPDGERIAWRESEGQCDKIAVHHRFTGKRTSILMPAGRVERIQWAADSQSLAILLAETGSAKSSAEGSATVGNLQDTQEAWRPVVRGRGTVQPRRRLLVVSESEGISEITAAQNLSCWSFDWAGKAAFVIVASTDGEEDAWYAADVRGISNQDDEARLLYVPHHQVGTIACSPDGRRVAVVAGLASDRDVVAGAVHIIDKETGSSHAWPVDDLDATYCVWRDDEQLLVAGVAGIDTVVGLYSVADRAFDEIWRSSTVSTSGLIPVVAPMLSCRDFAFLAERFDGGVEIRVVVNGETSTVAHLDEQSSRRLEGLCVEEIQWAADDGVRLQGFLLFKGERAQRATVINLHGGPVFGWLSTSLTSARMLPSLTLIEAGYAIFLPNPRGSWGRGHAFAAAVIGDLGGVDASDVLRGIEMLVDGGFADPSRLGLMGNSYGGFLACWLITTDNRFAAAVASSPATNHVTADLASNIHHFVRTFVGGDYRDLSSHYYARSPVLRAEYAETPIMLVCGDLDECTPAVEAIQFHCALCRHGKDSVLVRYPAEGHGIRSPRAVADFAERITRWFQIHIPLTGAPTVDRARASKRERGRVESSFNRTS